MAKLKVIRAQSGRIVNGRFVANPRVRNIPGFMGADGKFHPLTARRGEQFSDDYREKGSGRFIPLKKGKAARKKKTAKKRRPR